MSKKAAVEVPGDVTEPTAEAASSEPIVPTAAELELLAALRSGKTVEQAIAPSPVHVEQVVLKDASEYDVNKIHGRVLTNQGWLVGTASQAHANG